MLIAGPVSHAGPASAHSGYETSEPADGQTLPESPERVDAYFSQEMARSGGLPTLVVVNEAGDQVDLGAVLDDEDRTHISAEMPPALPEGRYTVIWHTISDEDGEEAQGAFHFFVGSGPDAQPTPASGSETPADTEAETPSPTTADTPPPSAEGGDDSGVPVWALLAGIIGGVVVGGGSGLLLGRRRTA